MTLTLTFVMTFCLSLCIYSTKSFLNWASFSFVKSCKSLSFSVGLIKVQQSLSLKKNFNNLLILFFYSTASEHPFCSFSAFSKYYFEEIRFPSGSTSFKVKSLNTHINDGNIEANSSISSGVSCPFFN